MAEIATRMGPLDGRSLATNAVVIEAARPASRIALRAPSASLAALSLALGVDLPNRPKSAASRGTRHALWLGPDEWLIIDEDRTDLNAVCRGAEVLHSCVDVSHRNTAILVSGTRVEDVLSAGCPQDLSLKAFPVAACSRTVLGKIEIVLYRTAEDDFRIEVWRSFSDYAFTLLTEAARDLSS